MTDSQLAIHGGTSVFPEGPPNWPVATEAIKTSILAAIDSGDWGKYEAELTEQLAQSVAKLTENEHCLLCSSGTIAVELALRGVGVGPDAEVILAGYDFPGNFRAIEAVGARPVLSDVVPTGWVLNPDLIAQAISPTTRAIVISHLHGQVADVAAIRAAANAAAPKQEIKIVEDICQMPGGMIDDKMFGSDADVAALSFGGSKILSAGRGGAITSNSEGVVQRAKIFASRGNEAFPLSQLQAAALMPQFDTLADMNRKRHESVQSLLRKLEPMELAALHPLAQVVSHSTNLLPAFYKLGWLFQEEQSKFSRDEVICAIQAEGVAIDVGFRGFTRRSARRCRKATDLENSKLAAEQTLLLHHPVLLESEETISRLASAIEKVFGIAR